MPIQMSAPQIGMGAFVTDTPVYKNQLNGNWKSPSGKYVVLMTMVGLAVQGDVASEDQLIGKAAVDLGDSEGSITRFLRLGAVRHATEFEASLPRLASLAVDKSAKASVEAVLADRNKEIVSMRSDLAAANAEISLLRKGTPVASSMSPDVEKVFADRQAEDGRRIADLEATVIDLRNQAAARKK